MAAALSHGAPQASAKAASTSGDFWAALPDEELARSLLASMSDEEALGQILMLSYPGDKPDPALLDWIASRALGGVKIFGWNAEDTDKLAAAVGLMQGRALAGKAAIPLFIATDQEGGWIRHIKGDTSVTPGNMAIGASGLPHDAYRSALLIGRELAALGVNMNFAPTVDLATRPRSFVIGPRAFGDDPMFSAALGAAYARGLADAGVIATAKHFPGHGDTELDSHNVLPIINVDIGTLWERELVPFRVLASEGIPAVMSGHLAFPRTPGGMEPASLSRYFMTELLREKMGFAGIAITDDLEMSGASENGRLSFPEVCRKAIEAGNDLIMTSRPFAEGDAAWQSLLRAYKNEAAFRARVQQAALRVLLTKLRCLKPRGRSALLPDRERLGSRLPDPEAAAFFKQQAARSATSVLGRGLPFAPRGRLLAAGPFADFFKAASAAYPGAASFRFSLRPESAALPAELNAFEAALAGADAVLVCVANRAGMQYAERARAAGKAVAILSVQSPAPVARAEWASAVVAVYGYSTESLAAGLAALSGRAPATGRLPLKLDP